MNLPHNINGHPKSTRGKTIFRSFVIPMLLTVLVSGCAIPPASMPQASDGEVFQFKLLDTPTSDAVAMAPTSTPMPEPTDTPVPTDTPTPEPTDTPTPEPTDTPVPTDTPTPEPTDTPVPTDTPTPEPTDTPVPTDTPTPEPTDTPVPTVTPTPEPTTEPEEAVEDAEAEADGSTDVKLTVGDLLSQNSESESDGSADNDAATAGESAGEEDAANGVLRLGDLLNQSDTSEATTTQTSDDDRTFVTVNSGDRRLNVRRGPDASAGILTALDAGSLVEIVQLSDDGLWGRISTDSFGSGGWINMQFTAPAEGPIASDEAPATISTATDEDATDEAIDTTNDSSGNNETAENAPSPAFTEPTAITQPENMNVRSGPGTAFDVVIVAPAGTQYEILGITPEGDWYVVSLPGENAVFGWVFVSLTETAGPVERIPVLTDSEIPSLPEPEAGAQTEQTVAVAGPSVPAAATAGFFGYGVQAHMLGGGIDEATSATQAMGFNWLKQQVEWRIFEGSPGAIDFSELRRIVDSAGARGISVLFSVVNAPDWAREAGFDASVGGPPADPQAFANFVGRLAGEFCGSPLKAIEVWNEQNLHYEWGNKPLNPGEYMNLLRAAYGSIKNACPSMLVISGALTPTGPNGNLAMDDFAYLEQMYQNGLASYADGIGAHPSGYNVPASVRYQDACATIQQTGNFFNGPCDTPHHSWSFLSSMEGYRNIMNVYGDSGKRIWPTEFGWAAGGAFDPRYAYADDNSYDEQARWTVEAFEMMRGWGWVGPAFLWNLNFRVVANGTEKAQWGIVRNDYSPLPIYDALRNMPK